jgi:hypothetical protein
MLTPSISNRTAAISKIISKNLRKKPRAFSLCGAPNRDAYAAKARRTAAVSICSACSVKRQPLMKPMRFKVRSATGSHKSAETPSANIAMTRCSSESRSVHEMPSIDHLGSLIPLIMIRPSKLKIY